MVSSKKTNLSIITVNFGHAKNIQSLWQSIKKFPPSIPWELIIVDNHSPRQENKSLTQYFQNEPHVHIISLTQNIGFGRGNEEGVKFAQGDILTFINPDIEVTNHCFNSLIETIQNQPKIGIAAPLLQTKNGKILPTARCFPSFWSLVGKRLWGIQSNQKPNHPISTEWVQGSFLVMKKNFFTEILEGFDQRFFLFFEDTDLCRRTWEKGYKVVQVPSAIAFHSEKRLSGEDVLTSLFKKTFWIHITSAFKYFQKYKKKKKPQIF